MVFKCNTDDFIQCKGFSRLPPRRNAHRSLSGDSWCISGLRGHWKQEQDDCCKKDPLKPQPISFELSHVTPPSRISQTNGMAVWETKITQKPKVLNGTYCEA